MGSSIITVKTLHATCAAHSVGRGDILLPYGGKTAGYIRLLELQPGSPIPYWTPDDARDSLAFPARAYGEYRAADIDDVFTTMTAGRTDPGVLMARSSEIGETPGKNPTVKVAFDPHDSRRSRARFVAAVQQVAATSEQMGVLTMWMVGGITVLPDGRHAAGYGNVSFYGDSHHPMRSDELYLAFANGLGTTHAEGNPDAIPVTALRQSGLITMVGNRATEHALVSSGTPVDEEEYRQHSLAFFDIQQGTDQTARLDIAEYMFRLDNTARSPWMALENGRLQHWDGSEIGDCVGRAAGQPDGAMGLGHVPFGEPDAVHHLISILKYLGREYPVQIEGAFSSPWDIRPVLFQLTDVPASQRTLSPLTLLNPDYTSSDVIGVSTFSGPCVVYHGDDFDAFGDADVLAALDARFAERGYILLAPNHGRYLTQVTPHCRCRLSRRTEHLSSHPVTHLRLLMAAHPHAGYLIAMQVQGDTDVKPDETPHRRVRVYHRADLQANGSTMALRVQRPPSLRERWRAWWNTQTTP